MRRQWFSMFRLSSFPFDVRVTPYLPRRESTQAGSLTSLLESVFSAARGTRAGGVRRFEDRMSFSLCSGRVPSGARGPPAGRRAALVGVIYLAGHGDWLRLIIKPNKRDG